MKKAAFFVLVACLYGVSIGHTEENEDNSLEDIEFLLPDVSCSEYKLGFRRHMAAMNATLPEPEYVRQQSNPDAQRVVNYNFAHHTIGCVDSDMLRSSGALYLNKKPSDLKEWSMLVRAAIAGVSKNESLDDAKAIFDSVSNEAHRDAARYKAEGDRSGASSEREIGNAYYLLYIVSEDGPMSFGIQLRSRPKAR